jgi:hypothetical protein
VLNKSHGNPKAESVKRRQGPIAKKEEKRTNWGYHIII